eukprot:545133-Pyramimonas_sp.AAC.1
MAAAIDYLWVVAPDLHRAMSFVEVFASEGSTTHCVRDERTLTAYAFERRHAKYQDATLWQGMLRAFYLAATVEVGGDIHFSPECSSWIN